MMSAPTFCPPSVGGTMVNRRLDLRIEDPTARVDWDDLLATHPHATFFHGSSWAKTLASAYGFRCRYVTAVAEGRLQGLLPVMEANSWLTGKRGVSLPFTDECSPLVSDNVTARSLFDFALEDGQQQGWKYLELRGGLDLFDELPESVSYFGHVLPLESSFDVLFENCDSAVRRAIRKAERCGVNVRF
ncbi:MAG TPA: hypothetical protein VNT99_01570, partial [Methylomirabilota bacterium]|nr:hypothetical protein [Methylomirabilota bacterium]